MLGHRHHRPASVARLRISPARAGPVGEHVPTGRPDRLGNRVERHAEHVVQHKRHPLPRAEPAQHLQQRRADLVVQGDPIGRVRSRRVLVERGHLGTDVAGPLVASPRRTHLVEAEPAGHHRQPRADILDLAEVGAGEPQKRFLRNVFGVPDIAQHLVRQIDQVRAMPTPGVGDPVCSLTAVWLISFTTIWSAAQFRDPAVTFHGPALVVAA